MRASHARRSMATRVIGTDSFWPREPLLPRKVVRDDNNSAGKRVVRDTLVRFRSNRPSRLSASD
jgi:hypothetical protein